MAANKLDSSMLENDAVTGAKLNPALVQGDIIYADGTDTIDRLAKGAAAEVLTMNAGATAPEWAAAAGGDKRNFIIDGDFTQWPTGDNTSWVNGAYGPALWECFWTNSGAYQANQETTVLPTVGQSSHSSASCLKVNITTADASVAASDYFGIRYHVTGYDYMFLHAQEVTLAFWIRSGISGTFAVSFQNNNASRTYTTPVTINSADTWEYKTITLTLDNTGTWLFDEGVGLRIAITFQGGSNYVPASESQWVATQYYAVSGQTNMIADATKDIYISQVGLYLGSTAPTFSSPPIAAVQSQVDYYVENIRGYIGSGWANTGNAGVGVCHWTTKLKPPAVTYIDQTLFYIETSASGGYATTMGMYNPLERTGRWSWAKTGASHTTGSGAVVRADGTGRMLVDARH